MWWGGFLICGASLIIIAIPFFFFPKELKVEHDVFFVLMWDVRGWCHYYFFLNQAVSALLTFLVLIGCGTFIKQNNKTFVIYIA